LEALPAYIRETAISRGVAGTDVQCADVLFLAFRDWNVGDASEREAVLSQISAPVAASTIPAAIASIRRWRTSCRRAVELEIAMPDVQVRYRSVRRAFEGVLAQHHMLNMKLQMMELDGSLPNKPTEASLELVVCYLEGHFETLAATSAASGEQPGAEPSPTTATAAKAVGEHWEEDWEEGWQEEDWQEDWGSGVVATWLWNKGFGFITPDDGGEDVFIHGSICEDGVGFLCAGDEVQFLSKWNEEKGKWACTMCNGPWQLQCLPLALLR